VLSFIIFGTNIFHGGPLVGIDHKTHFSRIIAQGCFRSTVFEFVQELMDPPPSAYREAADWINEHLTKKQSVWVVPNFATYPLMYHAPHAVYTGQLREAVGQFKGMSEMHVYGKVSPEYIIVFGPYINEARHLMNTWEKEGYSYQPIQEISHYWYDLTRPELFWHAFSEISNYSNQSESIKIFKRSLLNDMK